MAISRLSGQDAKNTTTGSGSATYPGATTAGNLLIACVWSNISTNTMTISGWTQADHIEVGSNANSVFYKLADGTESTVTVSAGSNIRINIFEYTGNANPIVLDASNNGTGASGTSTTSASVTTTATDDLVLVSMTNSTAMTVNSSSWTAPFNKVNESLNAVRLWVGDNTSNSPGSIAGTTSWSVSAVTNNVIAAFKSAAVVPNTGSNILNMGIS